MALPAYRVLRFALAALLAAKVAGAQANGEPETAANAAPETLTVLIDQAAVTRLPDRVATVILGNPLIADVSQLPGGLFVLTGRSYGATNLLGLDRAGNVVTEAMVRVQGARGDVVVVYRGADRHTYSCMPDCERRITLGDGKDYFNDILTQSAQRDTQARGAAAGNPEPPGDRRTVVISTDGDSGASSGR